MTLPLTGQGQGLGLRQGLGLASAPDPCDPVREMLPKDDGWTRQELTILPCPRGSCLNTHLVNNSGESSLPSQ